LDSTWEFPKPMKLNQNALARHPRTASPHQ
jgi:hypothetical protein